MAGCRKGRQACTSIDATRLEKLAERRSVHALDKLGGVDLHMNVPDHRTTNLLVGSPIERIEDLRFHLLTGRGQYVDDLVSDRMLYAVVLRSSVAHGLIRAIDVDGGPRAAEVHAVITAADIGNIPTIPLRQETAAGTQAFRATHHRIRQGALCIGEPIALVIADTVALAEDALEVIVVDMKIFCHVVATRDAARKDEIASIRRRGQ